MSRRKIAQSEADADIISRRVGIFKALAHPIRLQMVEMLGREEELCVCVFYEKFGVDYAAVSRHLQILKKAGILEDQKRGKHVFYRLNCPCILSMCNCLGAK